MSSFKSAEGKPNCKAPEINDIVEKGEELIDFSKLLGKILKEGPINIQEHSEEWVQCHVVIRERGITVALPEETELPQNKAAVNIVMEFSSPLEVGIAMLPDNARRSRESKLFPFAVRNKTSKAKRNAALYEIKKGITSGIQGTDMDEVIFATSNGREMWEWASCVQWLGTTPKEEKIPFIDEPDCITMHNKHYEDAEVLQNALLRMFTYKNLPQKPITFEAIVRIINRVSDREQHMLSPAFLYYPDDFFSSVR